MEEWTQPPAIRQTDSSPIADKVLTLSRRNIPSFIEGGLQFMSLIGHRNQIALSRANARAWQTRELLMNFLAIAV
jgi:hypothetical protein